MPLERRNNKCSCHPRPMTSSDEDCFDMDGGRHNITPGQQGSGAITPPQASGSNESTAPCLTMIMGAINELKRDMEKLKREGKTVSKSADKCKRKTVARPNQEHVSPESQAGFSGFLGESDDSIEEGELPERVSSGSVLLDGARNYGPIENVSEELDKEIADMVNHLFVNGMRVEDYKGIMEDEVTLRPSNCHALTPVDCNTQIQAALPVEVKKADYRLREVDKDITKAATIMVKSLTMLDKVARDEELNVVAQEVAKLNAALALLGNAHYRQNLTRRTIIRRDINQKYAHLCSEKAPLTGLLFGEDLSQAAKQIEEADKLKAKFSTKKRTPFWSSTYGRFGGGRQRGYFGKVPSRGGSYRFQPYEPRRGATGRDARPYYPGPAATSKNSRGRGQYPPRR